MQETQIPKWINRDNVKIIYHKDFIHRTKKITAYEIWKEDEEKMNAAKQNGYDVLVVWESEYLLNKEYIIEKCIKFLKS